MFGFIRFVLRKINQACHPQKKPGLTNQIKIRQPSRLEKEKSSPAYHILLNGGLALLLLGMFYGGIYGAFFLDNLAQDQSEQLRFAIIYATRGQEEEAEQSFEEMAEMDEIMEVFGSGHAHLNLFGLIALALASNVHKIRLKDKWQISAAIVLLVGGLLFPVGLILQPLVNKTLGKVINIISGTGIMASIAIYLWGAVKYSLWERKKYFK
ncbi:MAG: hypothetical protein VR67_11905 [Peptococcaceae bacterium BRH_c8a]|nr:MAG: hypothetical protein VR67_11905 [Peptococcaceae bacterium BRH_c8a]